MQAHRIYLGLGSNIEREMHLEIALHMLEEHLQDMRCSPVYESVSEDAQQPPFYNLVVAATTTLEAGELIAWLKELEALHGRVRGPQRLIALDIDLLLFDDLQGCIDDIELPRGEILTRAFVLYPLQLLAPRLLHPTVGTSMAQLWQARHPGPDLHPVRHPFGSGALLHNLNARSPRQASGQVVQNL